MNYNIKKAGICPVCGSEELRYGSINVEDSSVFYPWFCESCCSNGKEYYSLTFEEHVVDKKITPLINFINRQEHLWRDLQFVEEELLNGNETLVDWLQEELLTIVDLARKE